MLKIRNDEEYGNFPTFEEIKRDLNELLDVVKGIHTVEKAKELAREYKWMTLEVNGELLRDSTPNDLEVEWIRYEGYGCLSYVYVRTDGYIHFDVWSNECESEFIDSANVNITEDEYNKFKGDVKWK